MFQARNLLALAGCLVVASVATAQAQPLRYRWQQGQVYNYRVEQATQITETAPDAKLDSTTKLAQTKQWQVLSVDPSGVATVQLVLKTLRIERVNPTGTTMVFDSANPDKSDPEMKQQLTKYVGVPLAVIRVDGMGKVVEVKESKFGMPSRFENELPFVMLLPAQAVQPGHTWERPYQITLDPPLGVGDKFAAVQKYACKGVNGNLMTIGLTTVLQAPPKAAAEQEPLLQFQPEGEVVFDVQAGRLHKAVLKIDKSLTNHQGEGTSYRLQSSYVEEFAGN